MSLLSAALSDIKAAIATARAEAFGQVTASVSLLSAVALAVEIGIENAVNRRLLYVGLLLVCLVLYRARTWPLKLRTGLFIAFLYFFTLVMLAVMGISGPGAVFLFAIPMLATIFFGQVAGIAITLVVILTWLGVGAAITAGHWPMPEVMTSAHFVDWVSSAMMLVTIIVPLILPLQQFLNAESFAVLTSHQKQEAVEARMALEKRTKELEQVSRTLAETNHQLQIQSESLSNANRRLHEEQEKLLASERMASLGRLSSGFAHELHTPLAAVRASLAEARKLIAEYQSALDDPDLTLDDHRSIARDMSKVIQVADEAAERAAGFVRSIKSQTRDPSPGENLRFNAVTVIKDSLILLTYALQHGRCEATLACEVDTLTLVGSPGRLGQVVTNLITNAIDASAARGGGPIRIQLARETDGLVLQVTDWGSGIFPEHLAKIFDPMFTTKPFGQGTGLGLAIVYNIVTGDFGGTIQVDSQPGQGTTFTIHFPLMTET